MSTQHNDHDPLERLPGARSLQPRQTIAVDHQRLARDWLLHEQGIPALRVTDPGRGRFSPLQVQADFDPPPDWKPSASVRPPVDQLFIDCRRLLKVHGDWIEWRKPYSAHE